MLIVRFWYQCWKKSVQLLLKVHAVLHYWCWGLSNPVLYCSIELQRHFCICLKETPGVVTFWSLLLLRVRRWEVTHRKKRWDKDIKRVPWAGLSSLGISHLQGAGRDAKVALCVSRGNCSCLAHTHAWYFLINLSSWLFTKQKREKVTVLYCRRSISTHASAHFTHTTINMSVQLSSVIVSYPFAILQYFAKIQ